MNAVSPEPPPRGRSWRVAIFFLVGLAIAGLGIGVFLLTARETERHVRAEIQQRLAAVRAAGHPVTAQDLAQRYPDPPPERDARRMLNRGLPALVYPEDSTRLPFFSESPLPTRLAPLNESTLAEAQQCLSQNSTALAAIPWDELPGSWVGAGFTNGLDKVTKTPSGTILLVRLLCWDAMVNAEQQHPKAAADALQRALAVANAFRNGLPLHSELRAASQVTVCQALERVVNRLTTDADLTGVARGLTVTNVGALRESLLNDVLCYGLFKAKSLETRANQTIKNARSPLSILLRGYQARLLCREDDLLDYLAWAERCRTALGMPLSKALPVVASMDRELDNPNLRLVSFLNPFRKQRLTFLATLKPRLKDFLVREGRSVAQVRTTLAALALERWRLAHPGRLPDSLAELVPDFLTAVPLDPFDDQPLRYKQLGRGYVIYSLGPDLTDDGGKELPPNTADAARHDITFTIER